MSKNGEYIGDRYVRLLHVPKQEMEEQVRLGTLAIPGAAAKMRQRLLRAGSIDMPTYMPDPFVLSPGMQSPRPVMDGLYSPSGLGPVIPGLSGLAHGMGAPGMHSMGPVMPGSLGPQMPSGVPQGLNNPPDMNMNMNMNMQLNPAHMG